MCILSMYLSKLSNNVKFNCKEKGLEEYIGEINKVYKPFMFFLYNKVLPIIRVGGRKLRRLKTH